MEDRAANQKGKKEEEKKGRINGLAAVSLTRPQQKVLCWKTGRPMGCADVVEG